MDNQTTEKVEIKKNKPVYFYAGIGLLAALLIVIIGIVGMVAYRSEKKFADDKFSLGVAKMIGLPAGFVNGNRIGYVEFIEDLQAVKESYKGATADQTPSEKEMRQNVWDMLVKNSVVRKEASKNNVVITDQD
ncbi:MAG TPA: SurA N-terminal domain-containing protein, partial [Candidatus Magasanikbacteria bacterium]|nr:SurA N-terminal domain-containing protein [Candidatus Magasanikbacteria bacterium]